MNIIFLSRKHGRPLTVQLKPRWLATAGAGLFALSAVVGSVGYWVTSHVLGDALAQPVAQADRAQQDELRAMSARMADIQARMMRIDALGAHLAESAKLKGDEFDFSRKPPMGGPEEAGVIGHGDEHQVGRKLSDLWQEVQEREAQLIALERVLQGIRQQKVNLDNMPVRNGYITSSFGYRSDPFTGRTTFHGGIDFAGSEGSDVFSVADGVVVFAGVRSGYGNLVEISHGDGLVTRYAHASGIVVKTGDLVSKDQLIAYMGSTGRSTGTHLHYEVLRDGKHINPTTVLRVARR